MLGERRSRTLSAIADRTADATNVDDACRLAVNAIAENAADLPFVFDNVALAPGMCGASVEEQAAAQPLATRMSEMLIAFARTGDPNCKDVPHWPSYDLKERNAMIFDSETGDTETRVEKDPRGAERVFAAGAHYRQPGT